MVEGCDTATEMSKLLIHTKIGKEYKKSARKKLSTVQVNIQSQNEAILFEVGVVVMF